MSNPEDGLNLTNRMIQSADHLLKTFSKMVRYRRQTCTFDFQYYYFYMRLLSGIRYSFTVVSLLVFIQSAAAQPGGPGGFGRGKPQTIPTQPARSIFVPVVLSGTVVRADGSPAPFGAVIEMNCRGEITRKATVDPNGRFSFRVDTGHETSRSFPDAGSGLDQTTSDSDLFGRTNLSASEDTRAAWDRKNMIGCELYALLHSHRSTVITLHKEPVPGLNEIGTVVVYPYKRVQGFSARLTSLMAPKAARDSLENAEKAIQKGKFDEAEKLLRSAIRKYPQFAEASFLLGEVCERDGRTEEARGFYHDAIKADPTYGKPYLRLAKIAAIARRWREAADLSEALLKLDPMSLLECYFINALAHLNLNHLDLAGTRAAKGQRIDLSNRFPQFCLIRASVFVHKKDPAAAVRELQKYLKIAPTASNISAVRVHIYQLMQQAHRAMK
jgi:hypothetical protein